MRYAIIAMQSMLLSAFILLPTSKSGGVHIAMFFMFMALTAFAFFWDDE